MGVARFWRLVGVLPYAAGGGLTLSQIALYDGAGQRVDGSATVTTSESPVEGAVADLKAPGGSVVWQAEQIATPSFFIRWEFAEPAEVAQVGIQGQTFSVAALQYSLDGEAWVGVGSVRGDLASSDLVIGAPNDFFRTPLVAVAAGAESRVRIVLDAIFRGFEDAYGGAVLPVVAEAPNPSTSIGDTGVQPERTLVYEPERVYQLSASNGTWNADEARFRFEFLNAAGDMVCFVRSWRKNGSFGHFLDYGTTNINVYQTAGTLTQYGGTPNVYSNTDGRFECAPGVFRFVNERPPVPTGNANLSFDIPCDAMSIRQVRVSEVRARSSWGGSTGVAYVRLWSSSAIRDTVPDAPEVVPPATRGTSISVPLGLEFFVGSAPQRNAVLRLQDGGAFVLRGTVTELRLPANVPLARRVRVYDQQARRLVREVWSEPDGSFVVPDLQGDRRYFVTAEDHEQKYRALVRTEVVPA